jgi:ketosteroid isomerase-like protein
VRLRLYSIATMSFLLFGCARHDCAEPVEISAVLDRQVEAWNRGDVEGFMHGYWKSEELEFATPDGTTRGWQATLDRYRKKYPTREAMGTLSFERLCVTQEAPDVAEVSGRYRLDRKRDVLTGRFTLEMRRIEDRWVIVRDYTVGDS